MIFLWPRITIFEFFADFLESNESFNTLVFFHLKENFAQIFLHRVSVKYSFANFLSNILLRIFLKAMKACLFLLKGDFRSNILLGFSVETSFADLKKKIFSTIFFREKIRERIFKKRYAKVYAKKIREKINEKEILYN